MSTKLHVAVDALGNHLRVILSAGQVFNIEWAPNLIDPFPAQAVIADKGYDADHFVAKAEATGQFCFREDARTRPITRP